MFADAARLWLAGESLAQIHWHLVHHHRIHASVAEHITDIIAAGHERADAIIITVEGA